VILVIIIHLVSTLQVTKVGVQMAIATNTIATQTVTENSHQMKTVSNLYFLLETHSRIPVQVQVVAVVAVAVVLAQVQAIVAVPAAPVRNSHHLLVQVQHRKQVQILDITFAMMAQL
jgi:hypothetical protein